MDPKQTSRRRVGSGNVHILLVFNRTSAHAPLRWGSRTILPVVPVPDRGARAGSAFGRFIYCTEYLISELEMNNEVESSRTSCPTRRSIGNREGSRRQSP